MFSRIAGRFLFLLPLLMAAPATPKSLLLISIDGMGAAYLTQADGHGLKIPNLRRMMKEGAYADGVVGVVPTVTYPSHTTLVTGVSPAIHGIYANTTFDPEQRNLAGWYWYAEDIKIPTLWDAASAAGLTTASVNWPVTVGAPKINHLIPEVWRTGSPEDRKLVRALSTPGMLADLESKLGPYAEELNTDLPNDRLRASFAAEIFRRYHPGFMTVHLAALDHAEHGAGPFSPEANEVLEGTDALIGQLRDAALQADPHATICVVSDHGFLPVTHHLNIAAAFIAAGLINPGDKKTQWGTPIVQSWTAMPWVNGGSVAVVLRQPQDETALKQTKTLLDQLAADPANGIRRVVGKEELGKLGGFPSADFLLDMQSGYQADFNLTGPLHRNTQSGGTHGYLPEQPELRSSFLITGETLPKGKNLGVIDMTQIAPTLARILGLALPSATGKALDF